MMNRRIQAGVLAALAASLPFRTGAQTAQGSQETSAPSEGGLEEVVVTAQKRTESLQRAAAAITVVSAEDLVDRSVQDIRAAEEFVPSVKTNAETTATQVFIRGIGKQFDEVRVPDAVGTLLDGVLLPEHATGVGLYDIHSIEVLPGPQGTLYGSSAIGGVINIQTNRPTRKEETTILAELGDYAFKHITVVQNLPVGADWSVRAAFDGSYRHGYNSNGTDNDNSTAMRLSSLYAPEDSRLSLFLSGSYFVDHYRQSPSQYAPYNALPGGDAYRFPPTDTSTASFYPPDGASNDLAENTLQVSQLTGELNWDLGSVSLSYHPGFLRVAMPGQPVSLVAGFPQVQYRAITQLSNELRLTSNLSGPFSWLAGLYQLYNNSSEGSRFGPNLNGASGNNYIRTYAAFAQGTYAVTNTTRLTLGLRGSRDSLTAPNEQLIYPIPPDFTAGVVPYTFNKSWSKVNWKAGIEQDVAANSLLYATVQTGSNPGSYNGNLPNPAVEVQQQTMIGYTVGLKNLFLDSRLKLNIEAFLYNYKNQIIEAPDLATGASFLFNAPKSQSKGLQLDTAFALTPLTTIHANAGYLNAQFKEFSAATGIGVLQNYAGYQLPFSPTWSGAVGLEQTFKVGEAGSVALRVDSYLSSSYWAIYSHTSDLYQGSYSRTDASLTYHPPSDAWDVALWAKNLENKPILSTGGATGRPYPFAAATYVDPPRTYGVRFSMRFGK